MKRPSLPTGISEENIDLLPDSPGVYLFYDKHGTPIYIGKAKNIRSRVLSHFSRDYRAVKEMKISQNLASIDHIKTAGELGALKKKLLATIMANAINRMTANDPKRTFKILIRLISSVVDSFSSSPKGGTEFFTKEYLR